MGRIKVGAPKHFSFLMGEGKEQSQRPRLINCNANSFEAFQAGHWQLFLDPSSVVGIRRSTSTLELHCQELQRWQSLGQQAYHAQLCNMAPLCISSKLLSRSTRSPGLERARPAQFPSQPKSHLHRSPTTELEVFEVTEVSSDYGPTVVTDRVPTEVQPLEVRARLSDCRKPSFADVAVGCLNHKVLSSSCLRYPSPSSKVES